MSVKKKSLVGWVNHEWDYNFKWGAKKSQGSYLGFKEIVIPETRQEQVGVFETKVRITIEEVE